LKKPGLLLALGVGKPKKGADIEEPESDEAEDEESGDFDSAAKSAFEAVQESDFDSFKAALKLAIMACQDEY
jgi:hypothetical protein